MMADAGMGALGAAQSYMRGDVGGMLKGVMSIGKRVMNGDKAQNVMKQTRTSHADVISWSGCKDSQTSADTSMQGQPTGAMSWAFITRYARQREKDLTRRKFTDAGLVSRSLTKYPQQTYL